MILTALVIYWDDAYAPRNTGLGSSSFDQGFRGGENAMIVLVDPFVRPVLLDATDVDNPPILPKSNVQSQFDAATGELFINMIDEQDVSISASGGQLRVVVDGQVRAQFDSVAAGAVRSIVVDGNDLNNTIDLSRVTRKAFVNLTSVRVDGGDGDDVLTGSELDEHLIGGVGRDVLNGRAGNDTLDGGAGNDLLDGHAGNDLLTGGDGHDTLRGGKGTDRLVEMGNANFQLTSKKLTGLGADSLSGIEAAELTGGDGDNSLDASGFKGSVTLAGGLGNDTLIGGSLADSLEGDDGNDVLRGGKGNDLLSGGADADEIDGGTGHDTLLGGSGDDTARGGSGNDAIAGDAGDDQLSGGSGKDTIIGGDGSDTLRGGAGNDTLIGGFDDDDIDGEAGKDKVLGGQGAAGTPRFGSGVQDAGDVLADPLTEIDELFATLFPFE